MPLPLTDTSALVLSIQTRLLSKGKLLAVHGNIGLGLRTQDYNTLLLFTGVKSFIEQVQCRFGLVSA